MKSPKTYKEAIEQSHREALYTVGAALLLFLFFWGVLFLTQDSAYWRLSLIRIGCLVISKVFPA